MSNSGARTLDLARLSRSPLPEQRVFPAARLGHVGVRVSGPTRAWVGLGSSLHLVSFGPFDNAANAVSGTTRTLRGEMQAMAALVASLSFPFSAR